MGKIFVITAREYMERVRTKWFVIATVFGPLFFGGMMGIPALVQSRTKASSAIADITILDATGVGLGRRIAERLDRFVLPNKPRARVVELRSTQVAAAESLQTLAAMKHEQTGFLVVDSSTLHGINARYAGRNASSPGEMEELQRNVRRALLTTNLAASGMPANRIEDLASAQDVHVMEDRITDTGRGGSGTLGAVLVIGVATLLYVTIVVYGQNVIRGVIDEKNTKVAEVVLASVSPDKLLAGKVIGIGGVALTQLAIWVASSLVMYQMRGRILAKFGVASSATGGGLMQSGLAGTALPMIGVLFLFFIFGFAFYASLYAAAGATVTNDQDAQQVAMPITLMLVASFIFVGPMLENPMSGLARTMSILPFSSPIMMPMRMASVAVPWTEIVLALVLLVLTSIATVWLAARIYRVGLLMYGKRPTMGELFRWIRYSN